MKVCFITPYPLRMISGVSRVVIDLCKGLKERGIDHLVITARHRDDIEKDEAIEAIEINVSKLKNFRDVYLAIKTASYILKYRRDIDILHLHSPHLPSFVSAILGRLFGKPVITTIHGKFPRPDNFIKRLYLRVSIRGTFTFSDRITFVNEEDKRHYNTSSATVIENGINTKIFAPNPNIRRETRDRLGVLKDDIVILYVGRVAKNKGVLELLDVIIATRNKTPKKMKLILVGPCEPDSLSEKIKTSSAENDVQLIDPTKEVIPYYCASDIFVLYSEFEGLSIALLEASSCGLAVISTGIGGIPSLITDGENGLLLEQGDLDGLIRKIMMLVENETLRRNMGTKARKGIIENYNFINTMDKYIDLYNKGLKDKGL
jgi:glycosyltransferase involved in cell wall biosynthesis